MDKTDNVLWLRLCDAGSCDDAESKAAAVATLLSCRRSLRSLSLNEPLLSTPLRVDRLLQYHFPTIAIAHDDDKLDKKHENSVYSVMKAILCSSTAYETPWKAISMFLGYLLRTTDQSTDRSMLRSSIVDIQCYFQQVVAVWWEEDRKETMSTTATNKRRRRSIRPDNGETLSEQTPKCWILRLVSEIMGSLTIHPTSTSYDESKCAVLADPNPGLESSSNPLPPFLLDLVSTIVSTCHGLETSLLHALLDLIFNNEPLRSDCIVPWVTMAYEMRLILRGKDWEVVVTSLKTALSYQSDLCPIPIEGCVTLVETIVSLHASDLVYLKPIALWPRLIVQVMAAAASGKDIEGYSMLESALESNLAALPVRVLQDLVLSVVSFNLAEILGDSACYAVEKVVETNLLLLCMRVSLSSRSPMVSHLIAATFGRQVPKESTTNGAFATDVRGKCWTRLVHHLSSTVEGSRVLFQGPMHRSHSRYTGLHRVFDEARYSRDGFFHDNSLQTNDNALAALSVIGSCIFGSVALDIDIALHRRELVLKYGTERARSWVRCACDALQRWKSGDDLELVVVAIVLITIYIEIPCMRSSTSQAMLEAYSTAAVSDIERMSRVHSVVISGILSCERFGSSCHPDLMEGLDHFSGVLTRQLDLSTFCCLARALSPLASTRRILLDLAKTNLKSVPMFHLPSALDYLAYDKMTKIKCGLFAATALLQRESWDESELEASLFLAQIILDNRPQVPISARSWLFHSLIHSLQHGYLSNRAVLHLLRVCLTRLLWFISPDGNGVEAFRFEMAFVGWGDEMPKQIEDVYGLFGLSFELLRQQTSSSSGAKKNLRKALCRFFDHLRGQTQRGKSLPLEAALPGKDPLETATSFGAGLADLAFFVAFLFVSSVQSKLIQGAQHAKSFPTHTNLSELFGWGDLGLTPESEWMGAWKARNTPKDSIAEGVFSRNQLAYIGIEYCDAVLDFLLGPVRLICSNWDDGFSEHDHFSELLAVSATLTFRYRRKLVSVLLEIGECRTIGIINQEKLSATLEGYCLVMVPLLRSAIDESDDAARIEDLVSYAVHLCETLSSAMGADAVQSESLKRWLDCLWTLHASLSDEKSARSLVVAFERLQKSGNFHICRVSVHEPKNVDTVVRWVRYSIFRNLSQGVALYRQRAGRDVLTCGPTVDQTAGSLRVYTTALKCLATDLVSGLGGGSGGLDYRLVLAMLYSMEHSALLLGDVLSARNSVDDEARAAARQACEYASKSLEVALCNFSLPVADIFKKTLLLCTDVLPTVASRARIETTVTVSELGTSTFLKRLLDQLCSILKRKVETLPGASWDTIAGSDHLGGVQYLAEANDDVSAISDDFDDAVLKYSVNDTTDGYIERKETILLRSERSWAWALCCVLQALENSWSNARSVPNDSQDNPRSSVQVDLHEYCSSVHQRKRAEALRGISSLFESVERPSKDRRPVLSVYAAWLPLVAHKKLLSTTTNVLTVLLQSVIKVLSQCTSTSPPESYSSVPPPLAEATSCVLAWLKPRSDELDFCIGLQRWYMAEACAEEPSGLLEKPQDTSVMHRLPKLMKRLGQLHNSLCKLQSVMIEYSGPQKRSAYLEMVETLLSGQETSPGSVFVKLVSEKVSVLEQGRKELESDFGVSAATEVSQVEPQQIQKTLRRIRRERRQPVLRSRNREVDMLLRIDRTIGLNEPLDNDAYADLEDFLVEG